jgi:hypothetical protein
VNHTMIAAEALRYRLNMVRGPLVQDNDWDLVEMAGAAVVAAEPQVDGAIRRIAEAWARAGLEPTHLCVPWSGLAVDQLFSDQPQLVDALDDILRVATRSLAA